MSDQAARIRARTWSRSRSGSRSVTFLSLWRWQRCTSACSPKTSLIARRSALPPSMTNRIACSGSRPRSTRSASSVLASVAFSVDPSHSPSGILTPSVLMPSATTCVASAISIPSSIITARRTSSSRRPISSESAVVVRSTNISDTDVLLVALLEVSTPSADGLADPGALARRDAGEHAVHHRARERVAVGEVLVGLHRASRARRRPCAPAADAPRRAGRRVSSTRPRGRDASPRAPGCACPSDRRPRSPRAPSARARRQARHRRSARAAPPSPPRRAHPAPPEPPQEADSPTPPRSSRPAAQVPSSWRFLLSRMDFKRPERCQPQRTGREDRRSNFYEVPDNLAAGDRIDAAPADDSGRAENSTGTLVRVAAATCAAGQPVVLTE